MTIYILLEAISILMTMCQISLLHIGFHMHCALKETIFRRGYAHTQRALIKLYLETMPLSWCGSQNVCVWGGGGGALYTYNRLICRLKSLLFVGTELLKSIPVIVIKLSQTIPFVGTEM